VYARLEVSARKATYLAQAPTNACTTGGSTCDLFWLLFGCAFTRVVGGAEADEDFGCGGGSASDRVVAHAERSVAAPISAASEMRGRRRPRGVERRMRFLEPPFGPSTASAVAEPTAGRAKPSDGHW
jgi:hypothetical protein